MENFCNRIVLWKNILESLEELDLAVQLPPSRMKRMMVKDLNREITDYSKLLIRVQSGEPLAS